MEYVIAAAALGVSVWAACEARSAKRDLRLIQKPASAPPLWTPTPPAASESEAVIDDLRWDAEDRAGWPAVIRTTSGERPTVRHIETDEAGL